MLEASVMRARCECLVLGVTFCVLVCCECGLLVHRVTRPLRGSVSCGSGWSVPLTGMANERERERYLVSIQMNVNVNVMCRFN